MDKTFHRLVQKQDNREYEAVLRESASLERKYIDLQDTWQLYYLHYLRGACYYRMADFENAAREYTQRLDIARSLNSPYLITQSLAALASAIEQQSKFDDVKRLNTEILSMAQTHNLGKYLSCVDLFNASGYWKSGRFDLSLREYTNALRLAYQYFGEGSIVEALEFIGMIMEHQRRYQESRSFYDRALKDIERFLSENPDAKPTRFDINRLNIMIRQGILASNMGKPEEAISIFHSCLESIESGLNELKARAHIELAEVYLSMNRNEDAEAELKIAMVINKSGEYQNLQWREWYLRGRLSEDSSRYQEAVPAYEKSIEIIEKIRRNIGSPELRHSFLTKRFDPYTRVIDLLYRLNSDKTIALEYINRAKSMTLKESLRLPGSTSLKDRNTQKNMNQAGSGRILEYFFTGERLLVFVTEQDGQIIETVSIPLSPETVESRVKELLASVSANNIDGFTGLSQQLYADLIAPVEQYLFDTYSGALVILPDGPLHRLPFAGLQNVRGDFIIEKTPIVYAPSRRVFHHCLESGRGLSSDGNSNVVLIDGTAGLPKGGEELTFIKGLYGGNTIVLGAKNLMDFRRVVADSEVLHFAGHAVSGQAFQEPVLMLQEFPDPIFLDSIEIRSWSMPDSCLVNLAGCSTATGPIAAGEAPWGLVPAFLNAGTSAVMANLMQVDDDSTRLLTRRFYEQLHKGTDKATALQKAQLAMLDRTTDGSKSLAWIPYILIGNPS